MNVTELLVYLICPTPFYSSKHVLFVNIQIKFKFWRYLVQISVGALFILTVFMVVLSFSF
jgi:hypothetical protein